MRMPCPLLTDPTPPSYLSSNGRTYPYTTQSLWW